MPIERGGHGETRRVNRPARRWGSISTAGWCGYFVVWRSRPLPGCCPTASWVTASQRPRIRRMPD